MPIINRTKSFILPYCAFFVVLSVLIFISEAGALGNIYYVRTDGGTSDQCNGLYDAAYSGSGNNMNCAWNHPFWALNGAMEWKISGGDTLMISEGSYMIGFGAPNTESCSENFPYDCVLPALPSGPDKDNPTRILGKGWNSGCAEKPELWGTERAGQVLDLRNASYIEISCLEVTDHSGCVEFHSNSEISCKRDEYPFGKWSPTGIIASDSENVTLSHLNIHGLAHDGIIAGRIKDWTLSHVRIAGGGWSGWEGDIGGNSSNAGVILFKHVTIETNGCAETYPGGEPDHCWAQTAGGYGDGLGTGATGGTWIIEDSVFQYNTSDGLDLLYVGNDDLSTKIEVRRTIARGNAGNPIKLAGSALIENSLLIADCAYFNGKPFAQDFMGDNCRAGGNALALALHRGSEVNVINNTIVGQSDVLVEAECRYLSDCSSGTEKVSILNNIFIGYADFLQSGQNEQAAFMWDPDAFIRGNIDYNIFHNLKFGNEICPFGPNDICADPLVVDGNLSTFNGHLTAESPAIDNAAESDMAGSISGFDLDGGLRPYGNGMDMGAYEYGATISGSPDMDADNGGNSPEPAADMKVNGMDGPLFFTSSEPLSLKAVFNTDGMPDYQGDVWIVAVLPLPQPFNILSYVKDEGWMTGLSPYSSGRSAPGDVWISNLPLPSGDYLFLCGMDSAGDGVPGEGLVFDAVEVSVTD